MKEVELLIVKKLMFIQCIGIYRYDDNYGLILIYVIMMDLEIMNGKEI